MLAPSDINEILSDPWTTPTLSLSKCQKLILDLIRDVTEPFDFLSSLGTGTDTELKITLMLCLVSQAQKGTEFETKASRQNTSECNEKW